MEVSLTSTLSGHKGAIYALAEVGDGLLTTGGDGNVVKWPLQPDADGTLIARMEMQIFSMAAIGIEQLLLGQMQGGIHVVDLSAKKETKHLALHTQGVFDFLVIGNTFLAAGGDGVLSFWEAGSCRLLKQLNLSDASLRCLAYHKQNQTLAVGSSDNGIYLLHYPTLKILSRLEGHGNSVFSVCFSPDGKYLLSGSRDAHLMAWDVGNNFASIQRIAAHLFTINHIAFSPSGNRFATAGRDKDVKIWDSSTFRLLKVLDRIKYDGHKNSVNKLFWGADYLVSAGDDRAIKLWQIT